MPRRRRRRGESLPPEERLRRRRDYVRCYRRGRRTHGRYAVVHAIDNELEHPRLGITVSKRVGNAVVRHLLKRRVREIYRRWPDREQLACRDLVVRLKPPAAAAPFAELARELERLLARQGVPAS